MPIKDGTAASQYHSETIIEVTGRINQRKATSGVRSPDPQKSILGLTEHAPLVYLNYHRAAYELGLVSSGATARFIEQLNLGPSSNVLLFGAGYGWSAEWLKRWMPGLGVVCAEPGAWIQANKALDEVGEIEAALDDARHNSGSGEIVGVTGPMRDEFMTYLDLGPRAVETLFEEDGLSNGSRNRLRQKGPFTHIITEHVLEWLWDDEAANLSDALRQIDANAEIAHYISPYSDGAGQKVEPAPMLNWKRVGNGAPVAAKLTDQARYVESDWQVLLPNDRFI